jgi:hypothetical protein
MRASAVTVCNRALALVPANAIASLDENSLEARECARVYQDAINEAVERGQWSFARDRVALAQVANRRPDEWAFAYALPTTGQVVGVFPATGEPIDFTSYDYDSEARWGRPIDRTVRYIVAADALYTDLADAQADIALTDPDPSRFPPLFAAALAVDVAARVCMAITKSSNRQRELMIMAETAWDRALSHELNERRSKPNLYLGGSVTGAQPGYSASALSPSGLTVQSTLSSQISDFSSAVRAQIVATLIAGSNITLTPQGDGSAATIRIAAAGGGSGGVSDGNKGDITVSNSAATWTVNASVLAGREPAITAGTTSQYWRGDKAWATLDRTAVGLGNVDNTSDTGKPVSTAQAAAIATKLNASVVSTFGLGLIGVADAATGRTTLGLGTAATAAASSFEPAITAGSASQYWRGDKAWATLNAAAVGLGNVDNTSDANKPVSTAQATAIGAKLNASAVSTFGLSLVGAADAAAARTTLGLGTAATAAASSFEPAIATGTTDQYWRGDKTWVAPPIVVAFGWSGKPGASDVQSVWPERSFTIASGSTDKRGQIAVGATGTAVDITVNRNGTTIGTIRVPTTTGAPTFSFPSAVSGSAGDRLDFIAPATQDATLFGARFQIILR